VNSLNMQLERHARSVKIPRYGYSAHKQFSVNSNSLLQVQDLSQGHMGGFLDGFTETGVRENGAGQFFGGCLQGNHSGQTPEQFGCLGTDEMEDKAGSLTAIDPDKTVITLANKNIARVDFKVGSGENLDNL
jgi:hypothetical protein